MLGDRSINCLLYADDLVIFSKSAKNLQIILNKLESFCENTDLRVNLDKTKIMIFVWDFPHFVKARELYLFICPRERSACHVVSISEPRRLGSSV